jgi:hypothetical protein
MCSVKIAFTTLPSATLRRQLAFPALPSTTLRRQLAFPALPSATLRRQLAFSPLPNATLRRLASMRGTAIAKAPAAYLGFPFFTTPAVAHQAPKGLSLVSLREWLTGLFGQGALRALGFSAETPTDPVALERFADEVQSALHDKALPKPRHKGVSWDPAETRAQFAKARAALQGHLHDVARETREAQGTLRAKNDAMSSYDQRFARVATFVCGLFQLACETALAARVRPSGRKPGQTADSDGEAPSGGPAAPQAG